MAAINVLLSFEKVKDLINSLPEETFKQGSELAGKKEMADAAIRQLEEFFDILNKGQNLEYRPHAIIRGVEEIRKN